MLLICLVRKRSYHRCISSQPIKLKRIVRYTYPIFIERATEIHGNKFDYSHVTSEHIQGKSSRVPIICKQCDYSYSPSIDTHINDKSRCLNCAGKTHWTLKRFLNEAIETHGDKYDYTLISTDNIQGYQSKVPVTCKHCNFCWTPRICNHISRKQGCPRCRKSRGEIACCKSLESRNISYLSERILDNLPRKRFDFVFTYRTNNFIVEFDGIQHFKYGYFHKDYQHFMKQQQVDILKTEKAIEAGYHIIRIDYTQVDNVDFHISKALDLCNSTYFSDPRIYKYIIDVLE